MGAQAVIVAHHATNLLLEDGNSLKLGDVEVELYLLLGLQFVFVFDLLVQFLFPEVSVIRNIILLLPLSLICKLCLLETYSRSMD